MKIIKFISPSFILLFFLTGCNTFYSTQSVQYKDYRITPGQRADSSFIYLLKPYADSLNLTMNEVIAEVGVTIKKDRPEGALGNLMADAYLHMTEQKFNTVVDAAFMNHGGIRLNELTPGPLTRGKVFELMPFDNLLLLQKIKGDVFQEYLDYVAAGGGAAVSGLSFEISNKKAINVKIKGNPLDKEKWYIVCNSDYVITSTPLLRTIPVQNINYLQRDALIDYFRQFGREGKKITAQTENRVVNVK
jgi:2',3'-cyclic-nucleotide 2'-phosphodiesterase (5'-nucleotidase family)